MILFYLNHKNIHQRVVHPVRQRSKVQEVRVLIVKRLELPN
jgi:hypothetical protein